jgi:4-hydroxy-3-methylbut-2-enyl diphosphate reductase
MGVQSYHVERADDIDNAWLDGVNIVGITAGASTPDDIIQDVVDYLILYGYARPTIDVLSSARNVVSAY